MELGERGPGREMIRTPEDEERREADKVWRPTEKPRYTERPEGKAHVALMAARAVVQCAEAHAAGAQLAEQGMQLLLPAGTGTGPGSLGLGLGLGTARATGCAMAPAFCRATPAAAFTRRGGVQWPTHAPSHLPRRPPRCRCSCSTPPLPLPA